MRIILRLTAVSACVIALSGCATGVATEPPPARCMTAPKPLGDIKPGDDLTQRYAELRRDYGREASTLRCVQSYVKALHGK